MNADQELAVIFGREISNKYPQKQETSVYIKELIGFSLV